MIIKSFEIKKIDLKNNKLILFFGKNEGYKNQEIKLLSEEFSEILKYEEKDILENPTEFIENLYTKSLFEEKKLIIIKRATDKIFKLIEELSFENIGDISILINAENLEKKSKLRTFFEKDKNNICVAFYPDNNLTMSKIANSYLKENNISISQSNLNLVISRCNEDRELLLNELSKLALFGIKGKIIDLKIIEKLTNVVENHNISLLVDQCLAKNKNKTIKMLNENNFTDEDSIQITRVFLNKSKKIDLLSNEFHINKDIELTVSKAKPPIFWKDKEITKQQIYKWNPKKIKQLIYNLNELELLIKKNINNSIYLITDFIIEQAS